MAITATTCNHHVGPCEIIPPSLFTGRQHQRLESKAAYTTCRGWSHCSTQGKSQPPAGKYNHIRTQMLD